MLQSIPLAVGRQPVHMAGNAGSAGNTVVVGVVAVVDVGIPAMPPDTAGIVGTAACIAG